MPESLSQQDFNFLKEFAEEMTGSVFDSSKKYLFENRLIGMAKEYKHDSVKSLVAHIQKNRRLLPKPMLASFIDLITTHETLFFRDNSPFAVLKNHLAEKIKEKRPPNHEIKFYSAACSTGQEPISIAITMEEVAEASGQGKYSILATDISEKTIQRARTGQYTQLEVQRGMPAKLLTKYFSMKDGFWHFRPEALRKITYRQENLLKPDFKYTKFDIVFCRNVTIYMDPPKVRKIYEHFHQNLAPEGYLIVGSTENMMEHRDLFTYERTPHGICYAKV